MTLGDSGHAAREQAAPRRPASAVAEWPSGAVVPAPHAIRGRPHGNLHRRATRNAATTTAPPCRADRTPFPNGLALLKGSRGSGEEHEAVGDDARDELAAPRVVVASGEGRPEAALVLAEAALRVPRRKRPSPAGRRAARSPGRGAPSCAGRHRPGHALPPGRRHARRLPAPLRRGRGRRGLRAHRPRRPRDLGPPRRHGASRRERRTPADRGRAEDVSTAGPVPGSAGRAVSAARSRR
jgi:hypothetical protein